MSILEKNLEALAGVDGVLAKRVQGMAVPAGFERVGGTDGTPTFRRVVMGEEGKKLHEWLGATSMPASSAEALVSSLDPSGGGGGVHNGLGLSIGTGFEWAAFARRLLGTQAVYVYEPTAALKMALEICDFSALIAEKKVVLLTGTAADAGEMLVKWLEGHLGMEPPTVLHPLPTAGGGNAEARNALLAAGEAIVRQGVLFRQGQLGASMERLMKAAALRAEARIDKETAAVMFLLTARYPEERPLHYHHEFKESQRLTIDRPETVGLLLRMEKLAELLERGPVRVVSDLFRGQLGCVPAEVPVETWVPPLVGAGYWGHLPGIGEFGEQDRVVVHCEDHFGRLINHGVKQEAVEVAILLPPPGFGALKHAGDLGRKHRVALVGDLPRVSAEAMEVVLPTHMAIYAAAREMIEQDYLAVHPGWAPDLLRRAMAKAGVTGVRADDPGLKEPMYKLIRDVLIPTVPLMTLARKLVEAGFALTLIGEWPEWEHAGGERGDVRLVPFAAPVEERWREVAVLVPHSPAGAWSPLVHQAYRTIPVVAVLHGWDGQAGSLAMQFQGMPPPGFVQVKAQQLFSTLKGLVAAGG